MSHTIPLSRQTCELGTLSILVLWPGRQCHSTPCTWKASTLALSSGPSPSFDSSVINSATVYLSVWYKVEIELSVNSYVVWDREWSPCTNDTHADGGVHCVRC